FFRNQVADPEAFAPGIAQGLGDVAAQRDRVLEARRDGQHRYEVAVLDGALQAVVVERKLIDRAGAALVDALEGRAPRLRGGGEAAGQLEQPAHAGRAFQLENGGVVDAARDRGERSDRREVDDIPGQERHVPGFVAREEQLVQVELRHRAVAALDLDGAHRAVRGGSAGGADRVHLRAERA